MNTPNVPATLLQELTEFRHRLHRTPELSNREQTTASVVADFLGTNGSFDLLRDLGGHGLLATLDTGRQGPSVLLRAELDALPVTEPPESCPHASQNPGVSHKCGHDGHMAILAGVGRTLAAVPPVRGSVSLLFQPAEETGEGARRVLDDPRFAALSFDFALALHNLPGHPLGTVLLRRGPMAAASCAIDIRLKGTTSHAAEPEKGLSPTQALCSLMQRLESLPQRSVPYGEKVKVTVVHARLGEVALGTSPGEARLVATLRAENDHLLQQLLRRARSLTEKLAEAEGLGHSLVLREPFPATLNDASLATLAQVAADDLGLARHTPPEPFPWSEDFGHFAARFPGLLIGLGAGEAHPALHAPDYDFPDALLAPGVSLMVSLVTGLTAAAPNHGATRHA